jgi:hypothetical protein
VVRLWEHVPLDEAVTTVVTALTATGRVGPPGAAGPAGPAGPADTPGATRPKHQPGPDQPRVDDSHS